MAGFSDALDDARIALMTLADRMEGLAHPTLRLGVTGLSRAGKTVFTTAFIHALTKGGRLPVFEAANRIARAELEPQPDDAVPRFSYEDHLRTLEVAREWPASTSRVSELRLAVRYAPVRGGLRTLTIDLVDYPGEWLLDLPLLDMDYRQFARQSLGLARAPARAREAGPYLAALAALSPTAPADEARARELAALFTAYLAACRAETVAMSLLPPGRFLMPGDLEGSPALTFAPLDLPADGTTRSGSLAAMMERRFEAYKNAVVRPFFRNHFARLDRQIVLVDALSALNAGPAALADLERALDGILAAFRTGRNSIMSTLFRPRIEKVLFAATKADHLHRSSHDRLEAILARLVERAYGRAKEGGASIDVVALAAIRATREAKVSRDGHSLDAIVGTPDKGQEAGGHIFDGAEEVAVFPGELPANPDALFDPSGAGFRGIASTTVEDADFRFLRFRPPADIGGDAPLPHIRLDRALQFLLGDWLA